MSLGTQLVAALLASSPQVPEGEPDPARVADGLTTWLETYPGAETALWAVGALFLAWLSNVLVKRYFLGGISKLVAQTRFTWDDAIQKRKVFNRLANVAPAVVVHYSASVIPGLPLGVSQFAQRVAVGFMVVVVVLATDGFLSALNDIYSTRPDAKSRPIKGYLQIVKIVLYVVAGIVVIATLVGRSPVVFLGGFGALTAIILLVFRDTILSLVASIQLTQNDMIAVGDWIEMPKFGADGDVVDIALHTVKVQNWDKTITTIPTHKLIEDSFKNWRAMGLSGGRRIKRALHLDLNTVGFLTEEEIRRLGRYELLGEYLRGKLEDIESYNASRAGDLEAGEGASEVIPEIRRLTNVGTLRAYIVSYLRAHPSIHEGMTLIVRQLQPGPQGLPMEIYAFSNDTDWVRYEGIQADIFDHILAILPEFGLRVYQIPSGGDLEGLRVRERGGGPAS
ncbi:mechanosensitive ion channel family protein [Gemmatimonadota bacterium]